MAGTLHNEELFAALAETPGLAEHEDRLTGADDPFPDGDVEDDDEESVLPSEEPIRASRRRVVRTGRDQPRANGRTVENRYALAERPVLQIGDVVDGKYRVERIIGRRGSGVLIEGRHIDLGQKVAIRHPPREMRARSRVVARFLRDARAASQILSEHAARILDVGRLDSGVPFLVMEGLDGWDFDEVLRVRGPLPLEDAVDYVVQASEAVAEAHGIGLVHRSIGLSNLVLTRRLDGSALVKVLDFGVPDMLQAVPFMEIAGASESEANAFMSALRFLSPEQVRCADDVDVRADLWALGAVLHELLIGAPAFFGASPGALLAAVAADPPRASGAVLRGVPPEIVAILLKALSKDRDVRFQSVAEFVTALRPYAPNASVGTVERISRMSIPSKPPPLPISHRPAGPDQHSASLPPVTRAPLSLLSTKPSERSSSSGWLAAAGIAGCLIGVIVALGTERLRVARVAPVAAAEKAAAVEPAPQPVAPPVATQAAPTVPSAASPKPSTPPATPPPATVATVRRVVAKQQAADSFSTPTPSKQEAVSASTKTSAPAPAAPPKGAVATSARDLFDDTR